MTYLSKSAESLTNSCIIFDYTLRAKKLVRKLTGTWKCKKEKFTAIWAPSCGIIWIQQQSYMRQKMGVSKLQTESWWLTQRPGTRAGLNWTGILQETAKRITGLSKEFQDFFGRQCSFNSYKHEEVRRESKDKGSLQWKQSKTGSRFQAKVKKPEKWIIRTQVFQ